MITDNLGRIRARLQDAAATAGRAPQDVELLAVSKGHTIDALNDAVDAGLTRFGENYLSEALTKIDTLARRDVEWVFMGPIQSNKTKSIAEHFDWVLGVASGKVASRLNAQRPVHLPPLQVCIQVNADADPNKAGVTPQELPALVAAVTALPRLTMRGLMTIPRKTDSDSGDIPAFSAVRQLFDQGRADGHCWDTLSMGMSRDFEAAIKHGSTQVRIGAALFGPRPARVPVEQMV